MPYGNDDIVRGLWLSVTTTELTAALLSSCRAKADALIDAEMEAVYPGSFPYVGTAPTIINSLSDDLTLYYCMRSKSPGMGAMPVAIKEEYWDKSLEILKKIRKKEIKIPIIDTKKEAESTTRTYTPTFDLDKETSWTIDSDRLKDIASDR